MVDDTSQKPALKALIDEMNKKIKEHAQMKKDATGKCYVNNT